jgi:hypothetical protein
MKQPSSLSELSLEEFSRLSPQEKRTYLRTVFQKFNSAPTGAPSDQPASQAASPASRG